jgi:hypothetical protein
MELIHSRQLHMVTDPVTKRLNDGPKYETPHDVLWTIPY